MLGSRDSNAAWKKALWQTALWWRGDSETVGVQLRNRDVLATALASCDSLVNPNAKRSGRATDIGTYIHEMYGVEIMKRVHAMFVDTGVASDVPVTHFVPGRIVNPRLAFIAATPDGFTVAGNEDDFIRHIGSVWSRHVQRASFTGDDDNDGDDVDDAALRTQTARGAPRVTYEFKTMQRADSKVSPNFIERLHACYTGGDVGGAKRMAIDEILERKVAGKWTIGDVDKDPELCRRVQQTSIGARTPKYFRRGCGLYPTEVANSLTTEYVTGNVCRMFADYPEIDKELTSSSSSSSSESPPPPPVKKAKPVKRSVAVEKDVDDATVDGAR